jgi:ion channel-forming bestrophin family protein
MASEMDWWAVPLVAFVAFTLYGIEGIAQTYEDPFGVHKIDINMDDIVEDVRREVEVMLTAWQTQGPTNKGIFRPRVGDSSAPSSPRSEYAGEYFSDLVETNEPALTPRGQVKFVVSDASASEQSSFREDEHSGERRMRFPSSVSPGSSTPRASTPRGERSMLLET